MSVRASLVKSNDMTKYVELYVEDLRTRVRFPPVPPLLTTKPFKLFLLRGFLLSFILSKLIEIRIYQTFDEHLSNLYLVIDFLDFFLM